MTPATLNTISGIKHKPTWVSASVATHQLHQTDASSVARRLDKRRARCLARRLDRSVESERHVDIGDVVVDSLGNTNHSDIKLSAPNLLHDQMRPAERSIASDREQQLDPKSLQSVDHFVDRLRTTGRTQDTTADLVNLTDTARGQLDRFQSVWLG